jgi:omega-6 fatty acid desaturase (delta-12 desaturase)
MRTGKELILATKPYAREIRWKSWFHTLSTLAILLLSLAGTYFIPNLYGRIACSIFSGFVMVRFFVIYHDHQHHAILDKSPVARFIFTLYGIFILAPSSIWKRSHDYHHKHNSKLFSASIGSYPIMTRQKFYSSTKKERFQYLAIRHPLTLFFGYISMFLYGMCIQSFLSSPRRHWDSLVAVIFHFAYAAVLLIFGGWLVWLLTFCVPFFIAFLIGTYLFYAQHNFPGVTFRDNGEWTYDGAALESSSFMKMNPFWHWVTGNIGYHHIHHINARIPFYRLPEAMAAIPELREAKTTSLKLRDIVACVRLKIWDPEKQKMVGLTE